MMSMHADEVGAPIQKRLGEVIKAERDRRELTQRELAQAAGLPQSQISQLEKHGTGALTLQQLISLGRALGMRVVDLLDQADRSGLTIRRGHSRNDRDTYAARLEQWPLAKHCLAEYGAYLLRTEFCDQLIGIDGGTTNEFLAEAIGRDVAQEVRTVRTIITNHIGVPERVRSQPGLPDILITGGTYRWDRKTLTGKDVVNYLEQFKKIKASVVGANGFDYPDLCTGSGSENDLKSAFIEKSESLLVLLDPSKWGTRTGKPLADVTRLVAQGKRIYLTGTLPTPGDGRDAESHDIDRAIKSLEESSRIIIGEFPRVEISHVSVALDSDAPKIRVRIINHSEMMRLVGKAGAPQRSRANAPNDVLVFRLVATAAS